MKHFIFFGASTGSFISTLHKNKNLKNLIIAPDMIYGNAYMNITYHF